MNGSPPRLIGAVCSAFAAAALAATLSACSSTTTSASPTTSTTWTIPLATSVTTPSGVWTTLAMGHLQDPLNTFWQLPFRPAGTSTWTNQVKATGTATNGGIVLAANGKDLAVAIRPSVDLTYTPLISTTDGGLAWSTGLIDQAITATPSALALGPSGQATAITASSAGGRTIPGATVIAANGNLSSWKTVATLQSFDSTQAGRACAARSFNAVGYAGSSTVVGASCTKPGSTGLFVRTSNGWAPTGPAVNGLAHLTVTVLALRPAPEGSGVAALLGVTGPQGAVPHLVAAWSADGVTWQESPSIAVRSTDAVVSFGAESGSELFVIAHGPGTSLVSYTVAGPGSNWTTLPPTPPGTATLAAGHAGTLEALAVKGTVLRIWTLSTSAGTWVDSQTINVNIQYGSSNP